MTSDSSTPNSTDNQLALSVSLVLFGYDGRQLQLVLSRRSKTPFDGELALPGRILEPNEKPEEAAREMMQSITGLSNVYHKQVRAFADPERHPSGRVVSIAFYGLIRRDEVKLQDSESGMFPRWHNLADLPVLPFDHNDIVRSSYRRMRHRFRRKPVAVELLPETYTLGDLQQLFEVVLGREFDKRNFQRRMKRSGLVKPVGLRKEPILGRPAKLYQTDPDRYHELRQQSEPFI